MGTFSLHFIEALLTIGVPRDRAQSLAELLERGIDERYSLHAQVLATKRDLADMEVKLMREMAQRAEQTNERISKIDERVSRIDERISAIDERISKTDESISKIGERVSKTEERVAQTNERIAQLETSLRTDLSRMEVSLRTDLNENRLAIAKVYERVAESKTEIIKWNLGALIAVSGMIIAFIKLPI